MSRLMMWFLYTQLGQWLSAKFSGGWCYLNPADPRFVVSNISHTLWYEGVPEYEPSQLGPSTQRNKWHTWVIFGVPEDWDVKRFVVIDTFANQRLACFGRKATTGFFGIKVGHEGAAIRLGARSGSVPPHSELLHPRFLARWREGDPWPLNAPKDMVRFI